MSRIVPDSLVNAGGAIAGLLYSKGLGAFLGQPSPVLVAADDAPPSELPPQVLQPPPAPGRVLAYPTQGWVSPATPMNAASLNFGPRR